MKNKEINIKKRRKRQSDKGSIGMNIAVGLTVLIIIFAIIVLIMAISEKVKNKEEISQSAKTEQSKEDKKEGSQKEEESKQNKKEEGKKAEEKIINLEDNEYMHVETDAEGKKVPVPNGYVGSSVGGENEENRINTGYVIYEGEEPVTEANVNNARKTRNQYVWVPVSDASKIYGTDANGKKWGKLYNFSTTSGDEVTGTSAYGWGESNGVMRITSNNREPDVLTDYDKDSQLKTLGLGAKTMHEYKMQLEREFTKAIKSIEKYGGYYIGRYETGGLNGTAKVVKGEKNIGSQTWYTMYKKCKELAGENINVETGMIWGCEQDRVLMWLIESGNKTKEQICKDSIDWGNYDNNAIEYVTSSGSVSTTTAGSRTVIPAGLSEQTKANNIYDLAGNVGDWGMEAGSTYGRRYRGGDCINYSTTYPASYRSNNGPTGSNSYYGCRATLYIR